MEFTCEQLRSALSGFVLDKQCDLIGERVLRITTPFQYPDGSNIDLFLEAAKDDLFSDFVLSDLGETAAYLHSHRVGIDTKKKQRLLESIRRTLEVGMFENQLRISIEHHDLNAMSDPILRLSQACIRVSDLVYLHRVIPNREYAGDGLADHRASVDDGGVADGGGE